MNVWRNSQSSLIFECQCLSEETCLVKNHSVMQKMWVQSLSWEDPLEEGTATHFSILAWRIPWMEEPGRLQSMESQRVRHDWSDWACMHTQHIVRNIWISASHLYLPPRDFYKWLIWKNRHRDKCNEEFWGNSSFIAFVVAVVLVR